MATEAVENYMRNGNRPYSVNDVTSALKDLNKGQVQKCLDKLLAKGVVIAKEYGKQKIYCAAQIDKVEREDEVDVDSKISKATEELSQLKNQLINADAKRKSLASSKTTEETEEENRRLEKEIKESGEKLERTRNGGATAVTNEDMKRVDQKREAIVKVYKKRKRIADDILDQILEGYPKTKKQLFEDIGIEDDASAHMPKLS